MTKINEAEAAGAKKECRWTEDDDGIWQTDCGEAFTFIDAGPKENSMRYCCYCGKQLVERKAKP